MKITILASFLFILVLSIVVGILVELGIAPSTGIWNIQHKGELLQGVLVAATALLEVDIVFILNIRSGFKQRDQPQTKMT